LSQHSILDGVDSSSLCSCEGMSGSPSCCGGPGSQLVSKASEALMPGIGISNSPPSAPLSSVGGNGVPSACPSSMSSVLSRSSSPPVSSSVTDDYSCPGRPSESSSFSRWPRLSVSSSSPARPCPSMALIIPRSAFRQSAEVTRSRLASSLQLWYGAFCFPQSSWLGLPSSCPRLRSQTQRCKNRRRSQA
jgi:hypothetical protein